MLSTGPVFPNGQPGGLQVERAREPGADMLTGPDRKAEPSRRVVQVGYQQEVARSLPGAKLASIHGQGSDREDRGKRT